MTATRYAIYYLPEPGSELSDRGQSWLGRECWTDRPLARPSLPGLAGLDLDRITAAPRRYGFHATLKPPFRLAEKCEERQLLADCRRFAEMLSPVEAPPLRVAAINGFLALTLARPCPAVDQLAARAVAAFEPLRAPLSADELARRRRARLSGRQEALLKIWGYPYVMEEFRFHMTLTGQQPEAVLARLQPVLEEFFMPSANVPLTIDAVALLKQADGAGNFVALERFRLAARSGPGAAAGTA